MRPDRVDVEARIIAPVIVPDPAAVIGVDVRGVGVLWLIAKYAIVAGLGGWRGRGRSRCGRRAAARNIAASHVALLRLPTLILWAGGGGEN